MKFSFLAAFTVATGWFVASATILALNSDLMTDHRGKQVVDPVVSQMSPRKIFIGQLLEEGENDFLAEVEGRVRKIETLSNGTGVRMQLGVGSASLNVEVVSGINFNQRSVRNRLVRVVGICHVAYNIDGLKLPTIVKVSDGSHVVFLDEEPAVGRGINGAVLMTAEAVHDLSPTEADQGIAVKIRGVVTGEESAFKGISIQDATGGLYLGISNAVINAVGESSLDTNTLFRVGDFVEVEGITVAGHFAPSVNANRITWLGVGRLPEPLHPAWDQLFNGSLDAQYVELKGVVTATNDLSANFLTANGVIRVMPTRDGPPTGELAKYLNQLIYIRGVLLAQWNIDTRQVIPGEIRICDPIVKVELPVPQDMFSVPRRTPSELLLYDSRASLFQRVCVEGQLIHLNGLEGYVTAETKGVRFMAQNFGGVQVGDTVEISGLPELGSAAPVLRDAVVRKTGRRPLSQPRWLESTNLNHAEWDSTRVRLRGELIQIRETSNERILDMKAGTQFFIVRLNDKTARLPWLPPGCLVELACRILKGQCFKCFLNQPLICPCWLVHPGGLHSIWRW